MDKFGIMDMDKNIIKLWEQWNSENSDEDLKLELQRIKDNESEIYERFYRNLEFGTGGLRGIIGVGTNRMNVYTVAKASQGYADYLLSNMDLPTVAIAYDSRIKSELFARVTAEVFAANGIHAYIFPELMPTPLLSFAVRYLKCSGGVVITASHNPSDYNGYKVYGADGCQITTHAAKLILNKIEAVDIFTGIKRLSFESGIEHGSISYINKTVVDSYLNKVSGQLLCNDGVDKGISIVYTPLNGTGLNCVTACLRRNGFTNIAVVKEQELPDGQFPTCPYPNPETKEALELGIRDAMIYRSDLVLATDPDCDRVGIAVRDNKNGYTLLSGNEIGVLLFDYICQQRVNSNSMPHRPVLIKTIVTTDMVKKVAERYNVQVIDVLTGFKFIGEQIGLLEKKGEQERYIFGFEESYGYLSGGYVRDKDGVNGSLLICEMAAYYKKRNLNLVQVLNQLYDKYGFCLNTLHSYQFKGAEGFKKMQDVMERLRINRPNHLADYCVESVSDFLSSCTYFCNGEKERISLPKSNVLKFVLEEKSSVVIRPSGTEPKLKLYFSVNSPNRESAEIFEKCLVKEMERLIG